jgi:hypothetical protein
MTQSPEQQSESFVHMLSPQHVVPMQCSWQHEPPHMVPGGEHGPGLDSGIDASGLLPGEVCREPHDGRTHGKASTTTARVQ